MDDNDLGFNSRPLSAEQVVALFQEYTPRIRFDMKGRNPDRQRTLKTQRSVRFQLEGSPPLSDTERDTWQRELNHEYRMNQMLRYNRAPRSATQIAILNLHHREEHRSAFQDDALLLKLSRQSVADAKSLDEDSCALQNMAYNDADDISFLFNLYNCLIRHHAHRSACSHNTLIDFIRDIQSIGYLLADGIVVTAYDVFARLVRLDEAVAISPSGTHYKGPVIGTHSGILRAFPWYATQKGNFLETWFPFDMGADDEYEESISTPPVLEIDTSYLTIDQEILRPLQFGESVSCRFLDTSGYNSDDENFGITTGVAVPTLYEEGPTRSVEIPPIVARRGRFKPQPSCGDFRPDDRSDRRSRSSNSSNKTNSGARIQILPCDKPPVRMPPRDITVDNKEIPMPHGVDAINRDKKIFVETDTQSTAGDSIWTFNDCQEENRQRKNVKPPQDDDFASWFHSTVDDCVTILTHSSSEEP